MRRLISSRMFLRSALGLLVSFALGAAQAQAQGVISQMDHQSWTARDGAPLAISALAQAPDGMLWIGSQGGVFSFDGLSFTAFRPPAGATQLPTDLISSLAAARDGSIWVGMMVGGLARIDHGHVTLYGTPAGKTLGIIRNVQQAPDGSIWCTGERTLARFDTAGKWRVEDLPTHGAPRVLLVDRTGVQWLAMDGALFRRTPSAKTFTTLAVSVGIPLTLVEAEDGTLLLSEQDTNQDHGRTMRLDPQGAQIGLIDDQDTVSATLPMPDGSVWLSTETAGLHRVTQNMASAGANPPPGKADRFGSQDGLAAGEMSLLLRDRDGDIWTGGRSGLDRFKPAWLQRFPELSGGDADFCINSRSELWVLSNSSGLNVVSSGDVRQLPATGDIYRIGCSSTYGMVYADPKGLWTITSGAPELIAPFVGIEPYAVRQIIETPDHHIVIILPTATGSRQLTGATWSPVDLGGIADHAPKYAYVDGRGRLWATYGLLSTQISVTENGHVRLLGIGRVPASADAEPRPGLVAVRGFAPVPQGMLAAGIYGVGFSQGATEDFRMLAFADPTLARGLTGIALARDGDLWLNGSRGIVRVRSDQLASALRNPTYRMEAGAIHEGSIVGPAPFEFLAGNSALEDQSGKLWFVTMTGIVRIDPDHQPAPLNLPVLSVRSIIADGRMLDASASLPPRPQAVEIRYFGLQLSAPEAVIYRYRLDGLDEGWQDVGTRTEAIYTHLPAGRYLFRVEASNGDGRWTPPLASRSFKVEPSFYQTWWFLTSVVVIVATVLWVAMSLWLQAAGAAIRLREEGRADERVRIARDLHDTLLQGVQGLVMNIHAILDRLSADQDARSALQDARGVLSTALDNADRIIAEGRDRVSSLRAAPTQDDDSIARLEDLAAALGEESMARYHVHSTGRVAIIAATAADEILSIAREAMTNAARHSRATDVSVVLAFAAGTLMLTCRDNGIGFDPSAVPPSGHWGLRGMKERVDRLGGRLRLRSKPGHGTEVRLIVPARRAYANRTSRTILWSDGRVRLRITP